MDNRLLVPLNPVLALVDLWDDIERMSGLDPKVHAAMSMLHSRFAEFGDETLETVAAVLWAGLRARLQSGFVLDHRTLLGDGERVLRTVEAAVADVFSHDKLAALVDECATILGSDTPADRVLTLARDEVRSLASSDLTPLKAVVGGVAFVAAMTVVGVAHTVETLTS